MHKGPPEHADRIPDLPKIIGFRNVLANVYGSIVPEDARDYAWNDPPAPRAGVQAMHDKPGLPAT